MVQKSKVSIGSTAQDILNAVAFSLNQVSSKSTHLLISNICSAERVFISGKGRSGLVGRMFAMRLSQLGLYVHHVDDCTCRAISGKDLLICISRTGKTETTLLAANNAALAGARIIFITAYADISKMSKYLKTTTQIIIPEKRAKNCVLGTCFELSCAIFLDSVILLLMKKLKANERTLLTNHSNL